MRVISARGAAARASRGIIAGISCSHLSRGEEMYAIKACGMATPVRERVGHGPASIIERDAVSTMRLILSENWCVLRGETYRRIISLSASAEIVGGRQCVGTRKSFQSTKITRAAPSTCRERLIISAKEARRGGIVGKNYHPRIS